jgi:hypothetical protein
LGAVAYRQAAKQRRIGVVNIKYSSRFILAGVVLLLAMAGAFYWHRAQSVIPTAWLVEKVNFAELEQQEWTRTGGDRAEQWKELKKLMQQGDEIWYYKSPPRFLADESGFALVRKGRAIAKVITLVS